VFCDAALDALPEARVHAREVRDHEIVFRRKLPVHAHLVHAGALDHRVHADRANAVAIKKILRGVEQLLLRGGAVHVSAHGFFIGDRIFIRYTYHSHVLYFRRDS
jgi:hypothetical protein